MSNKIKGSLEAIYTPNKLTDYLVNYPPTAKLMG
jgi:hypothetical protein